VHPREFGVTAGPLGPPLAATAAENPRNAANAAILLSFIDFMIFSFGLDVFQL
jgi:hypothetical protein